MTFKKNTTTCLKLMRVDKPVGFFLLLWPTLWALWIASKGLVSLSLFGIFTAGVFIMRSAGCVINDIADRRFDPHVARTANRPLARGDISLKAALILLLFLFLLAFGLVLCLNFLCFELACVGVLITVLYPFMKRWIVAPQCVLGIAFSLGIPMAYAAVSDNLSHFSWLLWGIGLLWPVIYDTLYAMADRSDDRIIGLHSTAILFDRWDLLIIAGLEMIWMLFWLILAKQLNLGSLFYLGFWIVIAVLIYQHIFIRYREADACFKAFLNHAWIGGILFVSLVVAL